MTVHYELHSLFDTKEKAIRAFLMEVDDAGEFCNPLWMLYDSPPESSLLDIDLDDDNESLLAFGVNGTLVGVARVTRSPKHIENGKIGFFIRPSQRRKKYAPTMIRMIEEWCEMHDVPDITAAVDEKNIRSLDALYYAGWERSGKTFKWSQGRTAIELKPKNSGA